MAENTVEELKAPLLAAVYVDVDDRRVRGLTPTPGFDALLRGAVMANEGAAVALMIWARR